MPMWDERVRDGPIVDKPAAVAKAPFSQKEERFQRVDIRAVTKRNLLTLAKVSIAGIISDIIVLAGGISSRGLHDGGRWWTREIKSSFAASSIFLFPSTSTTRSEHSPELCLKIHTTLFKGRYRLHYKPPPRCAPRTSGSAARPGMKVRNSYGRGMRYVWTPVFWDLGFTARYISSRQRSPLWRPTWKT